MDNNKIIELRKKTGLGVLDCKQALENANGDVDQAIKNLQKKGQEVLTDRNSKTTENGIIYTYSHGGNIAVMVELRCETDFVAKTDDFQNLAKDLALQITSMNPAYVSVETVPEFEKSDVRKAFLAAAEQMNKPAEIVEKIVDGKVRKYFEQHCLLEQGYIRDDKKKVKDVVNEVIAKTGEKIVVQRFIRWKKGE